jgi:hypothetical protein
MRKVARPLRRDHEPSQLPALAVGAGAASLPAASLAQYWTQYYPEAARRLQAAKVFSPEDLAGNLRPGDIGLQGGIFDELGSSHGLLQRGSTYAGGTPLAHGMVVGPKARAFHGGINLEQMAMEGYGMPARRLRALQDSAGIPVFQQLNAISNAWRDAKGNPRKFLNAARENLAAAREAADWAKNFRGPGKMRTAMRWLPTADEELPWEFAKDRIGAYLRSKTPLSGKQLRSLSGQLSEDVGATYNPFSAAVAGVKNVVFPRTPERMAAKLVDACKVVKGGTGQHCGSLPARVMQAIGLAKRRPGGGLLELPGNMLTNPNLDVVGLVGRDAKRRVMQALQRAAKGRTLAGLGAAGGLLGLGYGGTRLLQSLRERDQQT